MTEFLFFILSILGTRAAAVQVPGTPVDMEIAGDGVVVLVTRPAGLFVWNGEGQPEPLWIQEGSPAALCIREGSPAVTYEESDTVLLGERALHVAGGPSGLCTVEWYSDRSAQIALCLFQEGKLVLLGFDGTLEILAVLSGARDVVAADADLDGDDDLFASCCGTGVHLILNDDSQPVVYPVGSIGEGVKRLDVCDMNGDGYPDPSGIACSTGGAGWWENPGEPDGTWEYHGTAPGLQGPKSVACVFGEIVAGSLYSPLVLTGGSRSVALPRGITALAAGEDVLFAGHESGWLIAVPLDSPGML